MEPSWLLCAGLGTKHRASYILRESHWAQSYIHSAIPFFFSFLTSVLRLGLAKLSSLAMNLSCSTKELDLASYRLSFQRSQDYILVPACLDCSAPGSPSEFGVWISVLQGGHLSLHSPSHRLFHLLPRLSAFALLGMLSLQGWAVTRGRSYWRPWVSCFLWFPP